MRDAVTSAPQVRVLATLGDAEIRALSAVLIDCVEGGASVGFLQPMTQEKAAAYWREVAAGVARGARAVFAAVDEGGAIVGTAQLIPAQYENQPHRADLAKMLVHRRARRRGVGLALLAAAEDHARANGRTVLVLDTASDAAERLYARHGWQRSGTIPDYALWPDGTLCATTVWFKALTPPAPSPPRVPRS